LQPDFFAFDFIRQAGGRAEKADSDK